MARFAILNSENIVSLTVASDSIDSLREIFPLDKIIDAENHNHFAEGSFYNEEYNIFIPKGYAYDPKKNEIIPIL